MKRICVVGGGFAGLAAAQLLEEGISGRRNTRITRQANVLCTKGWQVTVVAPEPPVGTDAAVELVRVTVPHPIQAVEGTKHSTPANTRHESKPSRSPFRPVRRMLANIARGIASPFGQTINSILFKRAVLQWGEQRGFNVIQAHDAPALRAAC